MPTSMSKSSHLPVPLRQLSGISLRMERSEQNLNQVSISQRSIIGSQFKSRIPVRIKTNNIQSNGYERGLSDGGTPESSSSPSLSFTSSPSSQSSKTSSPMNFLNSKICTPIAALFPILEITESFPSSKARSSKLSTRTFRIVDFEIDWTDRNSMGEGVTFGDQFARAQSTAQLLHQIDAYFNQPIDPNESQTDALNTHNVFPAFKQYVSNIMRHEMDKEPKYEALFRRTDLTTQDVKYRNEMVDWVIEATKHYKFDLMTCYLATFLIDAMIHIKYVTDKSGWNLLALVAFHTAAKLEETNPVTLKSLARNDLLRFKEFESKCITNTEKELLTTLGFNVSPPLPQLMADIVIRSGHIDFPNEHVKMAVTELTVEILLHSLSNIAFSRLRASTKAQTAIKIATEYVMFNLNYYMNLARRKGKARNKSKLVNNVIKNSTEICIELFYKILFPKGLPRPRPTIIRTESLKVSKCI